MNGLFLYPNEESIFSNIVNLYSTITNDAFGHIGGKLSELPNNIRETVARGMISFLLEKSE